MGFEEMPTNQFIENSFYNFDSLFVAQNHPARDVQDTFYMSDPASCKTLDPERLARVKEMHEKGGHGSIGYRYCFSEEDSRKNVFRTHTTAVSSRMLFKIAEETKKNGFFTPRKLFSIDRVFRNESVDATHLAEFHQIEGVVADNKVGLGHLLGIIE